MEKVDRLGWTDGISLTAYGNSFGVRVNDTSVLPQIHDYLPVGWEPASNSVVDFLYSLKVGGKSTRKGLRRYNLLYGGSGLVARTLDMAELFDRLESHLQLLTAFMAKDCLFVHAGVVGWHGRALVMPGRSFCGKTDLVAALVRAGATYYSDEYAIFDTQGRVHPYPRPLSVRGGNGLNAGKYPVEELGGSAGQEPLPVGLIAVTEYRAGARWRPRSLSPGRAMLALMENTVAARREPQFSLPILQRVASGAEAVKSKRGEADAIARQLLESLVVEPQPAL